MLRVAAPAFGRLRAGAGGDPRSRSLARIGADAHCRCRRPAPRCAASAAQRGPLTRRIAAQGARAVATTTWVGTLEHRNRARLPCRLAPTSRPSNACVRACAAPASIAQLRRCDRAASRHARAERPCSDRDRRASRCRSRSCQPAAGIRLRRRPRLPRGGDRASGARQSGPRTSHRVRTPPPLPMDASAPASSQQIQPRSARCGALARAIVVDGSRQRSLRAARRPAAATSASRR